MKSVQQVNLISRSRNKELMANKIDMWSLIIHTQVHVYCYMYTQKSVNHQRAGFGGSIAWGDENVINGPQGQTN